MDNARDYSQAEPVYFEQELLDLNLLFHFGVLDDKAADKIVKTFWLWQARYQQLAMRLATGIATLYKHRKKKNADKERLEELKEEVSVLQCDFDHYAGRFFLSTPGGSMDSLISIADAMRTIVFPLAVVGTGLIASAGCWLIASGQKGNRYAYESTRFLLHSPKFNTPPDALAEDTAQYAKEALNSKKTMTGLLARWTGQNTKTIAKAIEGENWMSAREAKKLGLIDDIWRV